MDSEVKIRPRFSPTANVWQSKNSSRYSAIWDAVYAREFCEADEGSSEADAHYAAEMADKAVECLIHLEDGR